ncbi:MAG: hypothetical protein AB1405_07615 [Bdellovibrionota bacterium]
MNEMPPAEPPEKGLQIAGYPLSIWLQATAGFIILMALLVFLTWRVAEEPLEFEVPAGSLSAPEIPASPSSPDDTKP